MPPTKIHKAVFDGIEAITDRFNKDTFPQKPDDLTPEQEKIFIFLNSETSGFLTLNESDRPEIKKSLCALAGIPFESRLDSRKAANIPPYATIVLKETMSPYTKHFPIVKSKLDGYWTENGTGSTQNISPMVQMIRPATLDDIARFRREFPAKHLNRLYGAIQWNDETKLREALTDRIKVLTQEFAKLLVSEYPEGITEKGKQLLAYKDDIGSDMWKVLSIIIEDPAMLLPFKTAPAKITFSPYVAIIHTENSNGMSYKCDKVHIQAGIEPHDIFINNPDDNDYPAPTGNHGVSVTKHLRVATPEEIAKHIKKTKSEHLHLLVSCLTEEQVNSLI